MSKRYEHLLSPVSVRGTVLKNRMVSPNALPHFLQGPETWPAEPVIQYLAGLAKNGAAVVTIADWTDPGQRGFGAPDSCRFPSWDQKDPSMLNYLSQMVEAVHLYGSAICVALTPTVPMGYGTSDAEGLPLPPELANLKPGEPMPPLPPGLFGPTKALPESMMEEFIDGVVEQAKFYQSLGFDMCTLPMAYCGPILAQFLSPLKNTRTDKYGGSVENRARFPLNVCRAIKAACGEDFLIEAVISGQEDGGITIADSIAFAKLAEGTIDILQIRSGDGDLAHPTGFNSVPGHYDTLAAAEAIKASGANILVEPIGGYQNPDDIEAALAEGKIDLVGMARAFICDPEYGRKLEEGRGEDVVPCIRCNRCHGFGMNGPWFSACSVNPVMGLEHTVERVGTPPERMKTVAVVGGGPAGMQAALTAARRGHQVTLYERGSRLGGQLLHADHAAFKWPIKQFKDYLSTQLDKLGVTVHLNTEATPEDLAILGYDAVIAATGAVARPVPTIAGADSPKVWTPTAVFGRESELGRRVVVVGGAEIGAETGLYLAQTGHQVTVLTRQNQLAGDADRVHYYSMFREAWETEENFRFITHAATTAIGEHAVTYLDAKGEVQTVPADSVVLAGGMQPARDEAASFHAVAAQFAMVGDCTKVGNIQSAVRSAYGAASCL